MSEHGSRLIENTYLGDIEHTEIPHSVDTSIFQPVRVMRQHENVVGLVAANLGTRKLIDIQLEGFAQAVSEAPELKLQLYVHSDLSGKMHPARSIDYSGLLSYYNITGCTHISEDLNRPLSDMAIFYSMMDLLLNCTAGEGFGIPVIEAMACGVPAVTTKNSASQYVNPYRQVSPVVKEYVGPLQAHYSWPSPEGIAREIVDHFKAPEAAPSKQDLIALASTYDVHTVVAESWLPLLDLIDLRRVGNKDHGDARTSTVPLADSQAQGTDG